MINLIRQLQLRVLFFIGLLLGCSNFASKAGSFVSFENGMNPNKNFQYSCLEDSAWKIVKQKYDSFISRSCNRSAQPIIPKIVHHIWLGSPLPELYRQFRETWMKHNPGWTFILWTDKEMETFSLKNRGLYNSAKNYGQKSDIARYEILYKFGGLYVDTDFVCVKSFDEFHHCADFYAGIAHDSNMVIFNGMIGSVPGHMILKECIDSLAQYTPSGSSTHAILHETGPFHFTRCILKHVSYCDQAVIFPSLYFYPFFGSKKCLSECMAYADNQNCYAIHLYHGSWMAS